LTRGRLCRTLIRLFPSAARWVSSFSPAVAVGYPGRLDTAPAAVCQWRWEIRPRARLKGRLSPNLAVCAGWRRCSSPRS